MSNELQQSSKRTIRDMVHSMKPEIEKALPSHMKPDRLMRVFLTTIADPKFAACSQESLMAALMKCSQAGLEPDNQNAYLIPFGNTVQFIAGFKGLAMQIWNSGICEDIKANVVYEGDDFSYEEGSNSFLKHIPLLKGDRGKPYAAYSLVKIKGNTTFCIMRADEILTIRDRSQGYKSAKKYNKSTPWETDEAEMWKKSCVRRHSKLLPLSPELRERMEHDEDKPDINSEEARFRNARPVLADVAELPKETPAAPSDKKDDGDLGPVVETKSHLALRHLMKAGNITEAVFLAKMREGGLIDDSIDNLGLLSPKQCDAIAKDWVTLVEKMK